jgi:hypothetical protein
MEARVGIGLITPPLQFKYSSFHWQINLNRLNQPILFLTPLVSVLVSASQIARANQGFPKVTTFGAGLGWRKAQGTARLNRQRVSRAIFSGIKIAERAKG